MSQSIDIPPQFPLSRNNNNIVLNSMVPFSFDDVFRSATTTTTDTYEYSYKGQLICTLLVEYTSSSKQIFLRATRTDNT